MTPDIRIGEGTVAGSAPAERRRRGLTMAEIEQIRYLPEYLVPVSAQHLQEDEVLKSAVFLGDTSRYSFTMDPGLFAQLHEAYEHFPARALLLTDRRILIVEDPNDPDAAHASTDYLVAAAPVDTICAFHLRSHLLNCAATFITASGGKTEEIEIEYSGISKHSLAAIVDSIRAGMDGLPAPAYARANSAFWEAVQRSEPEWGDALHGLGLKLENMVTYYLAPGERIEEWVRIPEPAEAGPGEAPLKPVVPGVLLRTDRQLLMMLETMRVLRGQERYGSDAWIMPRRFISAIRVVPAALGLNARLHVTLEKDGLEHELSFSLPEDEAERAESIAEGVVPVTAL